MSVANSPLRCGYLSIVIMLTFVDKLGYAQGLVDNLAFAVMQYCSSVFSVDN